MPEHDYKNMTIKNKLPDFFFEIDSDMNFIYVNNSSLICGQTSEELLSLNINVILHPDDLSDVKNYMESAAASTHAVSELSRNIRLRRKSGNIFEYCPARITLYPILENSVYNRAIGIIHNISGTDESSQAMVLAEKHYRALLSNSGELILIITMDGIILFASESTMRLTGYHPFDLTGEHIEDFLPGEDSEILFTALKTQDKESVILRIKKNNKIIAYMNSRLQAVHDSDGNNVCVIINSMNIGKAIEAENLLKQTELYYDRLIDSAAIGVLTINRGSFSITRANLFAKTILGLENAVDSYNFLDLFDIEKDRACFMQQTETLQTVSNKEIVMNTFRKKLVRILLNAAVLSENEIAVSVIDISRFRLPDNEVYRLQRYDPLTNLPNRLYFDEYIRQKLDDEKIFALLCIGIDRFKQINDQYGHSAGDTLLKKLSDRIKNVYFSKDLVSRFESDRFMILISDLGNPNEGIDYDIIELLSRKTKDIFSLPFVIEANEVRLQASIGICFYPFDGTDSEVLINRTELSMFMAKERGGNTFSYYDDRVNTDMLLRYQLEKELFEAHASREFMLYYQPLVNSTGEVIAYEALLRWRNRRGEFVPPSSFIPIAEKNSLIVEIGYFVFEKACEDLALLTADNPDIKMNINISPVQFSQYDFIDNIRHIMHRSAVPISNIEIEITETALFDNMDIAVEKLHQFQKMGFSISIDDFGTGYSSLAKLKKFPLKSIKIDKSFIDDVIDNNASRTLVCTIIDLAHNLGCEVIAEGVEYKDQFMFLNEKGCDIYQGYFFSKPRPLSDLIKKDRKEHQNSTGYDYKI